jgi:3'(2'), 5'-bisphosphate nucleotidase
MPVMQLPDAFAGNMWRARLEIAAAAVRSAGAALLELRGSIMGSEGAGGQLKTSTDLAAEGWVVGFLRGSFPDDRYLAEEEFEDAGEPWSGANDYWTVDALDGTRSYVDGYDGFCVQVAYVSGGVPRLGAIAEPVAGALYVGAQGAGAWRVTTTTATRLALRDTVSRQPGLRFVDSTRPAGTVGRLYDALGGQFVECGSVGLKICRVAENAGDIYAKQFTYKLWDVAPGEVLLREVGAALGTWNGTTIDYAGTQTHYKSVLAAPRSLYDELVGSGDFSE